MLRVKAYVTKGYVFKNAADIRPYLEQPRTGITSRFSSEIAKKLQCYVFAGYPEALSTEELESISKTPKSSGETVDSIEQVGANSAVLHGPNGEWIGGYRKTHLFETDKTWAKPGKLIIHLQTTLSPHHFPRRHRLCHLSASSTNLYRVARHLHGS